MRISLCAKSIALKHAIAYNINYMPTVFGFPLRKFLPNLAPRSRDQAVASCAPQEAQPAHEQPAPAPATLRNPEASRAEELARAHEQALREAYAWPRCGEAFPRGEAERRARLWAINTHGTLSDALAVLNILS